MDLCNSCNKFHFNDRRIMCRDLLSHVAVKPYLRGRQHTKTFTQGCTNHMEGARTGKKVFGTADLELCSRNHL